MRIIYKDRNRIFVFSNTGERDGYLETLSQAEQRRHSDAVREIHSDFINEIKAEESYNAGTKRAIEKLRSESKLEAEIMESE